MFLLIGGAIYGGKQVALHVVYKYIISKQSPTGEISLSGLSEKCVPNKDANSLQSRSSALKIYQRGLSVSLTHTLELGGKGIKQSLVY